MFQGVGRDSREGTVDKTNRHTKRKNARVDQECCLETTARHKMKWECFLEATATSLEVECGSVALRRQLNPWEKKKEHEVLTIETGTLKQHLHLD